MTKVEGKTRNLDMTQGSMLKSILLFAIPLFIGNLFQQFYNLVDSWVVGKYVSDDALAAVSSSGSLIHFFTSLVVGTCAGAGIVIAQYFGARETKRMQDSIHTTVAFGLVAGVVLTFLGVVFAPYILRLMQTPPSVLKESTTYFRVYFAGVIFTCMYNVGSSIFRAVGDSRHPLYYLIVSSVLNVLLDILFVKQFHLGVAGVALATIISQAVSAIITFAHLMIIKTDYTVKFKKIRFYKDEIGKIVRIGLPNGIQNSIISLSNVFVLTGINMFGSTATAGWGSYSKVEGFATMPSGSFSIALSNYVGQNIGAKKYDRAKKGAIQGMLTSIILTSFLGLMLWIFASQLIGIFTDTPAVVAFGTKAIKTITLFYCLLSWAHALSGVLRGAGVSELPMFVMIICWCVVRITTITTLISLDKLTSPYMVFVLYPITWGLSIIVLLPYLLRSDWLHYVDKLDNSSPEEKKHRRKKSLVATGVLVGVISVMVVLLSTTSVDKPSKGVDCFKESLVSENNNISSTSDIKNINGKYIVVVDEKGNDVYYYNISYDINNDGYNTAFYWINLDDEVTIITNTEYDEIYKKNSTNDNLTTGIIDYK